MTIMINNKPVVVTLTPDDIKRLGGVGPSGVVFKKDATVMSETLSEPFEVNEGDVFVTLCTGAIPPKTE